MPQNQQQHKKKKKGRSPAHQNTFAYTHNPKSKKTAAILANPIQHVCRRCQDKLEWRKQYRKYKPRTVPGKCNLCQKRNVLAAYHTVCESCTRVSNKAVALLEEWNRTSSSSTSMSTSTSTSSYHDTEQQQQLQFEQGQENPSATENTRTANEKEALPIEQPNATDDVELQSPTRHRRVCAMCVKEPALPDDNDDGDSVDNNQLSTGGRRLRLRERKTLERKEQQQPSRRQMPESNNIDDDSKAQELVVDNNSHTSDASDDIYSSSPQEEEEKEEEADPFLQAVGGADKLLTGEAYQQMLLEQERLQISSQL